MFQGTLKMSYQILMKIAAACGEEFSEEGSLPNSSSNLDTPITMVAIDSVEFTSPYIQTTPSSFSSSRILLGKTQWPLYFFAAQTACFPFNP